MRSLKDQEAALLQIGWDPSRQEQVEEGLAPARVALEHRGSFVVLTGDGELSGQITGRLRHEASGRQDLPAVGDWVAVRAVPGEDRAMIHRVLPRTSRFVRKVAGVETEEQIVAANVDVVFLVSALDRDQNLRRMERYLTMAWESGALPVIVLSKADLCPDLDDAIAAFSGIAPGCAIHAVSNITDEGFEEIRTYLLGYRTIALLGSSGVGKSTIVNRLLGTDRQKVRDIRHDGKGRHTTTHRELLLVPGGGLLIDTPGMRELQLWDADEGLDSTFTDIAELADGCRFNDCSHTKEPGCAVVAALEDGSLGADRLESYRKLGRELAFLERKKDKRLAREESKKWRKLNAEARSRTRIR